MGTATPSPPPLQLPKVGGLLSCFERGMVALSPLPTVLGVEQKYLNGGLVEHCIGIVSNHG